MCLPKQMVHISKDLLKNPNNNCVPNMRLGSHKKQHHITKSVYTTLQKVSNDQMVHISKDLVT